MWENAWVDRGRALDPTVELAQMCLLPSSRTPLPFWPLDLASYPITLHIHGGWFRWHSRVRCFMMLLFALSQTICFWRRGSRTK